MSVLWVFCFLVLFNSSCPGCSCKVRSARRRGGGQSVGEGGGGIPDIYLPFPPRGGRWIHLDLLAQVRDAFTGMFPSSASTTPFSVKDILNLEHQNNFADDFLMASQDAPVHYQQGARGPCGAQPDPPCVSGMAEKLDARVSAAEEERNEHGEIGCDNGSDARVWLQNFQRTRASTRHVIVTSSPF